VTCGCPIAAPSRRDFLTLVGSAAAAAWPLAARAQQQALPVVGFLNSGSAAEWAPLVAAFKEGLNELGFVEGRNVAVEYRWAQGENERLPRLAADLVGRQVVVIAAFGPPAALAAKAATTAIPIVFMAGTDPIDLGLVTNFRRPTANVTGLNVFAEVLTPKRQELLHELVPAAPVVAMLVDPTAAQTRSELRNVQAAADRIGQQVRIFNASSDREIDAALATNDFWMARIRRDWWPDELRNEPARRLSSAGHLHGTEFSRARSPLICRSSRRPRSRRWSISEPPKRSA
jgi:putative ABC transport system substrate-binding protein